MSTTTKTPMTETELVKWMEENIAEFESGTLDPEKLAFLDENMPGWNDEFEDVDDEALIDARIAEVDLAWREAGWDGVHRQPSAPVPSMEMLDDADVLLYAAFTSYVFESVVGEDRDCVDVVARLWSFIEAAYLAGIEPQDVVNYALDEPVSSAEASQKLSQVSAATEG